MTKTIAVIGMGSIGRRHAKNLQDLGCDIVTYDPADHRGATTAEGAIQKADAVVIASPTPQHYFDITDTLCELKPMFVEKPIANRLPDIENTFNSVTMVGYNLRFHGCVKKAKEWIDGGLLGEPLWAEFVCAQFNDRPHYRRDGVILNWSHEIDLCTYLLGTAHVAASSTRISDGGDDMTDILLTHDNGCRAAIHLDYVTPRESRMFKIKGTKADIFACLEDGHRYAMIADGSSKRIGWPPDSVGCGINDTFDQNYVEEMQAFLDRLDGKETIGCTGAEALETLKICLEVRRQAGLK